MLYFVNINNAFRSFVFLTEGKAGGKPIHSLLLNFEINVSPPTPHKYSLYAILTVFEILYDTFIQFNSSIGTTDYYIRMHR